MSIGVDKSPLEHVQFVVEVERLFDNCLSKQLCVADAALDELASFESSQALVE